MIKGQIPSRFLKTLSLTRSALYFAESIPLSLLAKFITGVDRREFRDPENLKILVSRIDKLLEKDAERFANGDFPLSLLRPSSPIKHTKSFADVLFDALFVAKRMREQKSKDLPENLKPEFEDAPEYFRRNFHFQTDGYFSRSSAKRYEHQVDILFSGTTDAMRRQAFTSLLKEKNRPLKVLELGCGLGSATRQFSAIYPKAQIVATDLSPAYLLEAKERLINHPSIHFLKMDASNLSFKDNEFDVVFHVFMFHEMPAKIRKKVMSECFRVLKPNGRLIVADSLQLGDDNELDWALKEFPTHYHEPFYLNYIKSPLKKLFAEAGFKKIEGDHFFLTKAVSGIKPEALH